MEWLLSRDRNINNNKKSLLSKQEYEKKIDILARYCSDYRSGIFPQRIELHDEIDVFNDLIKKYFELLEVLKEYEINEVYQTMKIKIFRFEVNNASCHPFESDLKECWANRWVKEEQKELASEKMIEDIINDFIKDKKVIDIKINNIDVHYHNNGYDNRIHLVYTVIYE